MDFSTWMLCGLGATFLAVCMMEITPNPSPPNEGPSGIIGWAVVCLVLGLWPRLRFLGAFASPILFGIGSHGPELDNLEDAIVFPDSLLRIEHRPNRIELDRKRGHGHDR